MILAPCLGIVQSTAKKRLMRTPDTVFMGRLFKTQEAAAKINMNSFDGKDFSYAGVRDSVVCLGRLRVVQRAHGAQSGTWVQHDCSLHVRHMWTQIAYSSLRTPRFCLRHSMPHHVQLALRGFRPLLWGGWFESHRRLIRSPASLLT